MKNNLILLGLIAALVIAAKALVNFTYEPNINYVFFVPIALCAVNVLVKRKSLYAELLITTGAGLLYLFVSNFFAWDVLLVESIWLVIGTVLTFLFVYLYNHFGITML